MRKKKQSNQVCSSATTSGKTDACRSSEWNTDFSLCLELSLSKASTFDAPESESFDLSDEEDDPIVVNDRANSHPRSPASKRTTAAAFTQSRKRLKHTTDAQELADESSSSISSDLNVFSYHKGMDKRSNQQLKRVLVGQERLEKSMKHLFHNQKKIQKAFRLHQVRSRRLRKEGLHE